MFKLELETRQTVIWAPLSRIQSTAGNEQGFSRSPRLGAIDDGSSVIKVANPNFLPRGQTFAFRIHMTILCVGVY